MAQVAATKANLAAAKKSLELAQLGFELMDRKKNILVREMMNLVDDAKTVRTEINASYEKAYKYLRLANTTLGLCDSYARTVPIDTTLSTDFKSVMGVEIPIITIEKSPLKPHFGLMTTNDYLDKAYVYFNEAKEKTVHLAEVECDIYRLADAIKKTRKRANALNNIMIPRFTQSIKNISEALDEKEREDFTRLKVIKARKESEKNKKQT